MPTKRCPGCSAELVQEPYIINGESIMFWVCPEGDWEEPVETESTTLEVPEAES